MKVLALLTIVLLAVCWLGSVESIPKKNKASAKWRPTMKLGEEFIGNYQNLISLIFMNHHRPHNLARSLSHYANLSIVNDIIVLHSSPVHVRHFDIPKVTNIMTYFYNDTFGPAERFFHYSSAKKDIIVYIDDDVFVKEEYFHKLYSIIAKNITQPRILGPNGRNCTAAGYFHDGNQLVITTFLMTQRYVIHDYMKYGFPIFQEWLYNHHGNCEDISFNLFFKSFYYPWGRIQSIPSGPYLHMLDETKGISYNKTHNLIRGEFCMKYHNISIPPGLLP